MTQTKRATQKPEAVTTQSNGELAKVDSPRRNSEKFLAEVEKQFLAEMGAGVNLTALQRTLVQHMYLKIDQALKASEEKRTKGVKAEALETAHENPRAFTWQHVDRQKLALDTVHRVSLALDALIPNHIWPIAYWNDRKGMYDMDLRIGYVGRDFIAREYALDKPLQIVYSIVYESDTFKALPRSASREVESYEFEIPQPFDRGEIVGGFGYIVYDDARKNQLVLVSPRDFDRSQGMAGGDAKFWRENPVEMRLKTIVHRTATKVPLDPAKINAGSLAAVLTDDNKLDEDPVDAEYRANANYKTIDVTAGPQEMPNLNVGASAEDATSEPEPVEVPF